MWAGSSAPPPTPSSITPSQWKQGTDTWHHRPSSVGIGLLPLVPTDISEGQSPGMAHCSCYRVGAGLGFVLGLSDKGRGRESGMPTNSTSQHLFLPCWCLVGMEVCFLTPLILGSKVWISSPVITSFSLIVNAGWCWGPPSTGTCWWGE